MLKYNIPEATKH